MSASSSSSAPAIPIVIARQAPTQTQAQRIAARKTILRQARPRRIIKTKHQCEGTPIYVCPHLLDVGIERCTGCQRYFSL